MADGELDCGEVPGVVNGVLIVDDEAPLRRFLRVGFENRGWTCIEAESGRAALEALRAGCPAQLILLDIGLPDMTGLVFLRHFRALNRLTPVIVLSGVYDVPVVVEAMRLGAVDYLSKPFSNSQLEDAVRRACNWIGMPALAPPSFEADPPPSQSGLFRSASDIALSALSSSLGAREEQTRQHSVRVSEYASRLGRQLGLPRHWLADIRYGALIHDVGKIGLPNSILLKPGPLTIEERREVEQHPEIGQKLVREIPELHHLSGMVLSHHERFDGHGYPNGASGRDIPLGSRVISVVDTYDSLTSSRPYRRTLPHVAAIKEIERCSGTQFDPEIVAAFCQISAAEIIELRSIAIGDKSLREAYHATISSTEYAEISA